VLGSSLFLLAGGEEQAELGIEAVTAVKVALASDIPTEAGEGMIPLRTGGTLGVSFQVSARALAEIRARLGPYLPARKLRPISHSIVRSYDSARPDKVEIQYLVEGEQGRSAEFVFVLVLGDTTMATWCTLTEVRAVE
jgi:hypothetical protein